MNAEQERDLRALHDELPTRPGHWMRQLEGSYGPRADLATLDALNEEWLYVDRGWREMQWSTHCNREEHRWTLRERGVTLAGPEPRTFVAEVPGDLLRECMRSQIPGYLEGQAAWTTLDLAWSQRYAVASLARMLYTLETGEIASKPAALAWAQEALGEQWRPLLQRAHDERAHGWNPSDRTPPELVAETVAFADAVTERAARD